MAIAVCLVISVVLWTVLTLQDRRTITLEVETRVVNLPDGEALTTLPPSHVRVQVEGEGLQLLSLYANEPTIPVDATLSTIEVAEALDLPAASNLRIASVTPQQIQIQKEPIAERRLPVRSKIELRLPPAHELIQAPYVEPDSITVSGARSVVNNLRYWPTDSLVIEDVRDSLQTQVPLADTLSRLVTRSTDTVTLHAAAGKFAEAQREVDVEVTGVPSDQNLVQLEPSTIRVRYRVLFDQLFESQRASDFFATVSYSQIRSDTTGYVEPRIHVPTDLSIRDPEPLPPRLRYYTFVSGE